MPSPSAAEDRAAAPRILVVDDDLTVRGVVIDYLTSTGYEVEVCGDGQTALQMATEVRRDLIVLDIMLPHIDGLEVFRRLRAAGVDTPIIMLTAKNSEADRILGLEVGADDYVTKPFSPRELVLRVQSILRRTATPKAADGHETITDDDLELDLTARTARRAGEELPLTLREYDLLAYLMAHPDQVFSRDQLMDAVWGWKFGDSSTVTVHVRRVRAKIEEDMGHPTRLLTVWGRGYRWVKGTSYEHRRD